MPRLLLSLLVGTALSLSLSAQSLIYVIAKVEDFSQTDASTTSFNSDIGHTFTAEVIDNNDPAELSSGNPSTAPTVDHNATTRTLSWNTDFNQWNYEDSGYASAAALDAVYGDIDYDFNFDDGGGTDTGTVTFSADAYPNTPLASLDAGTWSGGAVYLNVGSTLTISTNTFSTNYAGGFGDRVSIDIDGNGFSDSSFANSDSTSLEVSAFSLISGESYEVTLNFTNTFDTDDLDGDATHDTVASYVSITTFTIHAVPEPSTWAALTGLLALGFAGSRRSRVRQS